MSTFEILIKIGENLEKLNLLFKSSPQAIIENVDFIFYSGLSLKV